MLKLANTNLALQPIPIADDLENESQYGETQEPPLSADEKKSAIASIESPIQALQSELGKDFVNRISLVYPRLLSLKDCDNDK